MRELKPIGPLQRVDAEGFLINPASVEAIVPPWDALVAATVEAYRRHLGDNLHSVYVRGSVAQGTAVENISDLDSFSVTPGLAKYWSDHWGRRARQGLEERFEFCAEVELNCVPMAALWRHRRYKWARFHLKTQAACVFGEDLGPRLDPIRPGIDAMLHAPHVQGWLDRYRRKVERASRHKRLQLCRRIMTFILRAGFDVVMERERTYTRDLVRCYDAFAKHYPQRAAEMRHALELAIEPTADAVEMRSLFDGLGSWLVEESKTCIGEIPS